MFDVEIALLLPVTIIKYFLIPFLNTESHQCHCCTIFNVSFGWQELYWDFGYA